MSKEKEFSTPSLYDLVKNGENTTTLVTFTNINNTINGIKYYIEKDSQENKDPNAFTPEELKASSSKLESSEGGLM